MQVLGRGGNSSRVCDQLFQVLFLLSYSDLSRKSGLEHRALFLLLTHWLSIWEGSSSQQWDQHCVAVTTLQLQGKLGNSFHVELCHPLIKEGQ